MKNKPPKTRAEMEDLVRDICRDEIRIDELSALMKDELQRVRGKYEDEITRLKGNVKQRLEAAEEWVLANPGELASKKSIVMVHGTVGYRTGKPALKTLRGWTWQRVLEYLMNNFREFVRLRPEPAKETILENRERLGEETLRKMGLRIEQKETFYVSPHETETVSP